MNLRMYPPEPAVRDDLDAAHREVWSHVAESGRWWTAAQRRSAAVVVRAAFADASPLPPWAAASTDADRWLGRPAPEELSAAVVDALYRMTAHAHTLTEQWYELLISRGVHEQAYVELCGIVTSVTSVCSFARIVGALLPPFPDAHDQTAPLREAVAWDRSPRNWVPVAPPGGARASVLEALSVSSLEYDLLWNHLAPPQYMSDVQMSDLAREQQRCRTQPSAGRIPCSIAYRAAAPRVDTPIFV